ncbi:nucleoside transmembrane transporter FUN26 [Sporobolomyces salmoneus]|uniref:nucleoside transmembrane transporter FUN26 n=1 Tax=Sporobolomyces salmoneus TaxID=183962 RepID=UPI0031799E1C
MFAPVGPLKNAVSKVKGEIHVAEDLAHQATRSHDQAEEDGDEVPEDMDADEAEHVLDEEYRPLMEDDDNDGEGRRRRKRRDSKGRDAEGGTIKTRKLEVFLTKGAFFILGACILLAWNTEIVAGSYYSSRLVGSPFEFSYASFVALTFTTGNLLFLAHANATQQGADLARRISFSIIVMAATLILAIVTTKIEAIPSTLFFAFLIISAIVLSASASYLQNAVVALSAAFGPSYLACILSGQGGIGFAVAMIQLVAAWTAAKANLPKSATPSSAFAFQLETSPNPDLQATIQLLESPVPPAAIRQTAFSFFLTIGIFAVVSWLCYAVLIRLPLYRLVIRSEFDEDAQHQAEQNHSSSNSNGDGTGKGSEDTPAASLRVVERKVRKLGIAMFLVFGVTLSVFPSITSSILSVKTGHPDAKLIQQPELFVPLGFAVFAAGDWFGRVLPQWEKLAWTNWKGLMACSVARFAFIPLFLMCNQQAGGGQHTMIKSDIAYVVIMFLFSSSNGYISTLIMLASVVEPSLEADEVDIAATCLAFYLTAGLAGGSLISFAVRGAVCGCNPFVSPP